MTIGILFLVFFVLLFLGVPIAAALGLGMVVNAVMGAPFSLSFIGRGMITALPGPSGPNLYLCRRGHGQGRHFQKAF